jgi:hypothetical protein
VTTPWTSASSGTTYAPTPWGGILYLLNSGQTTFVDLGACLLAVEPTNAVVQKCATAYEEALECEIEACAPSCPVPTPPPGKSCNSDPACLTAENALDSCLNAASTGVCKTYVAATTTDCATIDVDSGPLSTCTSAVDVITSPASTSAELSKAFNQYFDTICTSGAGGG